MRLSFADKVVPYDKFVDDVATAIAERLNEPEFISQNEAFRRFGRANVMRWRRTNTVEPYIRPNKIEYRLIELRQQQQKHQDYY
jgi:hypothetical protein